MPGEILDQRWRIETRIGQGAMGSVFRGRDLQANKVVAIKILAPEHCRKPKVVARFEREAEKMTSLRHNNIVAFHGHGRRGVLPFIVMEFLEGLTLSDVLEKHGGKIGINETIAIVKQICSGLAFLHANGLVHRDVKPQNIFLGVGGRVIILDLGVVRDQANPGLTRPGAMVGTPYYMSPEQILGVEDIDQRTDVYALAAVTFELLTGRPPYLGNNNFEVLYGHKNTPPPDATALVKTVPRSVSQVLIEGLAKRRDERHESVTEFFTNLETASAAKKIDLAKAFNVAPVLTADKTRVLPRIKQPPPAPVRKDSGEVPEASNSDVVSVPGVSLGATGQSGEQKTVIHRFDKNDRTFVGLAPNEREVETRASDISGPLPTSGQLRVVVTAKGRAAAANVFVAGKLSAQTPCTLTLPVGPQRIRIELEGYRSVERWSDVAAGTSTNLRVFLEKA